MTIEEQLRWDIQQLKDANAKLHRRAQEAEGKHTKQETWNAGWKAGREERDADRKKELEKRIGVYKHNTRDRMAKLKAALPQFISDVGVSRIQYGAGLLTSLLEEALKLIYAEKLTRYDILIVAVNMAELVEDNRISLGDLYDTFKNIYNRATDGVEVVR